MKLISIEQYKELPLNTKLYEPTLKGISPFFFAGLNPKAPSYIMLVLGGDYAQVISRNVPLVELYTDYEEAKTVRLQMAERNVSHIRDLYKIVTIFLAFLLLGFTAISQELIADETILEQGKTTVKIVSSNYFIPDSILVKFDPVIVRYSVYYKKDRAGRYKEYSITLPIEKKQEVILFVQSLKRPK